MSKSSKQKKAKVPKLTEAEYAAYISALKNEEAPPSEAPMSAVNEEAPSLKLKNL